MSAAALAVGLDTVWDTRLKRKRGTFVPRFAVIAAYKLLLIFTISDRVVAGARDAG